MNVNRYYHILIVITAHSVPFGGIIRALGFLSSEIMMISGEMMKFCEEAVGYFRHLILHSTVDREGFFFSPNEHNRSFNATVVKRGLTDLVSKLQKSVSEQKKKLRAG